MGQPQWSEFFPDCGGSGQSPINMDSAQTKYEPRLAVVRPLGYSQHGNEPFTLSNNGHTGKSWVILCLQYGTEPNLHSSTV